MENFKLIKAENASVNRSIRLSKSTMDKLTTISQATGISVNKIIGKCIDFSLENMAKR